MQCWDLLLHRHSSSQSSISVTAHHLNRLQYTVTRALMFIYLYCRNWMVCFFMILLVGTLFTIELLWFIERCTTQYDTMRCDVLNIARDINHILYSTHCSGDQWLNYSKVGGGTLHFFPSLPFLFLPRSSWIPLSSLLPIPLISRPAPFQLFVLGERCNLPSGVWGGAPAEIVFGAFKPWNLTSGGNNFNHFSPNGDWRNVITRWRNDNFRWWNGNFRWWKARHRWRNAVPAKFNHMTVC